MSRLTRDGTAEPVSRDLVLRHARGQGNIHFPCLADHERDWRPYPVDPYSAICRDDCTYIHTHIQTYQVTLNPPREDRCEWHRMTRMTGPDCAVMCNLTNIHTYIHTYIHIHTAESTLAQGQYSPQGSSSNGCRLCITMDQLLLCASLFPHPLLLV